MGARKERRRLPRRTVEASRQLMLDAAVTLLTASTLDDQEAAIAAAAAQVRVTDVVEEATRIAAESEGGSTDDYLPMTIGALYQIWPTQRAFQADLVRYVAQLESVIVPGRGAPAEAAARGLTTREILRDNLHEALEYVRDDPLHRLLLGFYAHSHHPEVGEALTNNCRSVHAGAIELWRELFDVCNLQMRPPYTLDALATTVTALIEGFAQRWMHDPTGLVDPLAEPDWNLATRAMVLLTEAMTMPA
jgi:hypothetical protein